MINKKLLLLVILPGFLLVGCAEYWYREDKTFQQCQQARQECFNELQKRTDFIGTGDYEFEFLINCMEEKGYRLVKEGDLPLDVKRARPESSLHWRAKGIAGQLDQSND